MDSWGEHIGSRIRSGRWCNERVSLSDGDVAALAREAVDRRDPRLEVQIAPAGPDDPYRFGVGAWIVRAGGATSYITADMTWRQALDKLVADLSGRA